MEIAAVEKYQAEEAADWEYAQGGESSLCAAALRGQNEVIIPHRKTHIHVCAEREFCNVTIRSL